MSYGPLIMKYAQTEVTCDWAISIARLHSAVSLPCLPVWLNAPYSQPVEEYHDVCCSYDNWFIFTNCLPLSLPSYRDRPDPREKRYASIWISITLPDKSMHCMDVFLALIYRRTASETHFHTTSQVHRPPTFMFSLRAHQTSHTLHVVM